MDHSVFVYEMNRALMTVLLVSAPALGAAILVGISVGLIQALTQIQDQTLPQAVKLVAVLLVVVLAGGLMAAQVGDLASRLLDAFPALTR